MKNLLVLSLMLFAFFDLVGQIELPKLSPLQKIEQRVGLTDITVEYSRPAIRDRVIFGDLVPYGQLWRTGANRSTKITFSEAVSINNQLIPSGTYSLLTIPHESKWGIYLYNDLTIWDAPDSIKTDKVIVNLFANPISLNHTIQNLTITFDEITNDSFKLGIAWENTYASFPVDVRTNKIMEERTEKALDKSALEYHLAGYYYLRENIHLREAKKFMETAILLNPTPDYRNHLQLSYILEKLNDKEGAIREAQKSLEIAKIAGSKYGIEENTENLKKWGMTIRK